jgi:hypothetical protein
MNALGAEANFDSFAFEPGHLSAFLETDSFEQRRERSRRFENRDRKGREEITITAKRNSVDRSTSKGGGNGCGDGRGGSSDFYVRDFPLVEDGENVLHHQLAIESAGIRPDQMIAADNHTRSDGQQERYQLVNRVGCKEGGAKRYEHKRPELTAKGDSQSAPNIHRKQGGCRRGID